MTPDPGNNQPNQPNRQPQNQPPQQPPQRPPQQPPGQGQQGQGQPGQQGQPGRSAQGQGGQPPRQSQPPQQGQQPPMGQQGSQQSQQPMGQQGHQSQQPMGQQSQFGGQQGQPPQQSQQPPMGGPQGMQQGQSQQTSWGQPPSSPPTQQQGMGGGPGVQSGGRPGATQLGAAPLEPVSIEDIARTEIVTAERDDTVESIVEDMAENNVGSVVVVEENSPVGIVTDRTIALGLRETPDIVEQTAEDLMPEDLVTASIDSDAFEVLDKMSDSGVRRIPIVDEDDELQGIVTLDDVLLFLEDNLHTVAETVRAQFPDI